VVPPVVVPVVVAVAPLPVVAAAAAAPRAVGLVAVFAATGLRTGGSIGRWPGLSVQGRG
jgi:hypothetical protein